MEVDLLITNATIVTAADTSPTQDLAVKDEKIHIIGKELEKLVRAKQTIDAHGAYVTPGGVDSHVHLHQDNAPSGDTFETGTRSAIAGGTTTILAFATQKKTEESIAPVVEEYHRRASGNAYCDYGFHLILTKPNSTILEQELPRAVKHDGITSAKLYMTYDRLRLSDYEILDIMNATRALGMTTMIHAENGDMIEYISRHLEAQRITSPYSHAISRPGICEDEATYRAISLAELMDMPILIVHMSQKSAASHVRAAQTRLLPIHAETCPHYLYLTAERLRDPGDAGFAGAACVCSPPLRDDPLDLEAMWAGLNNGTFTVVSSDHAPHKYDDPIGKKGGIDAQGNPHFRRIPNGLPGLETRMALMMKGVLDGRIKAEKMVELCCSNPAKLYGLGDRKGGIAPGIDADLCIWYPHDGEGKMTPFALSNEMLHHGVDYSPFDGTVFHNWPRYTILRGKVVWDRDGVGVAGKTGDGSFLKRGSSTISKSRDVWVNEFRPSYPASKLAN